MRWWVALTATVAVGCGGEEFLSAPRNWGDGAADSIAVLDAASDGQGTDALPDGSPRDGARADSTSDLSSDRDAPEAGEGRDTTSSDATLDGAGDGRDSAPPLSDASSDAPRDQSADSLDGTVDGDVADTTLDVGRDTPVVDCSMTIIAVVSTNHGHSLQIPPADVATGIEKIYNARGAATHDHFVLFTPADFQTLRAGGTVFKRSCNAGDHEFALACVALSRQPGAPMCSDECGLTEQAVCP
ncbi:MAG: hypothetical protein ABW133_07095 [Polyangiaceae bacterium]